MSEACIVSIPDSDASTRVAALVRFQPGFAGNLGAIRNALSDKLEQYKLPTALRQLAPDEEIPATAIGKVIRRRVVQQFFAPAGDYQVAPGVEIWDITTKQPQEKVKAWDWAGLQGC